jgi:hypothetical protein
MTRKSRRATRFRRTLELGGSAPQTPEKDLGTQARNCPPNRGNLTPGLRPEADALGRKHNKQSGL